MPIKKIIIKRSDLVITGTLLALLVAFHFVSNAGNNVVSISRSPIVEIHPAYPANYADNLVLVGASHNIFVGKVVEQIGTKVSVVGPETQFSVRVISNIKGDLKGMVTVNQEGGYENGVLYVIEDIDMLGPAKSGLENYFLQPGSTYLLATRYDSDSNSYMLGPFSVASELISTNNNLADAQLKAIAGNDQRVIELQAAYPNEILLHADVVHGNTRNSHQSLFSTQESASSATAISTMQSGD